MIYFPIKITKFLLIIFIALLTFHKCFLSSKSISVNYKNLGTKKILEMQYENYLSSIFKLDEKAKCINNTKIEYFFQLPEETEYFLYLLYFLIATFLIVISKFKLNGSEN